MAILIKNPETERKARKLAALTRQTITGAIDAALDRELEVARAESRRPTLEEIIAATEELHEKAGVRGPFPSVTKAEWDDINIVPGMAEDDE